MEVKAMQYSLKVLLIINDFQVKFPSAPSPSTIQREFKKRLGETCMVTSTAPDGVAKESEKIMGLARLVTHG